MVLIASFALALAVSLHATPAQAQTGWEYVPELCGYLDWDTGLVWGEHSMNVAGTVRWDNVQSSYLPSYRVLTGIPDWRMPTVSESQSAAAHGINDLITPSRTGIYCWTSESKSSGWAKTAHFAVNPLSGDTVLYNNGSFIGFIPVYSILPPPPEPPSHPGKGKK